MPNNIIDKIRVSGTDYTLSATTSGVSVVEVTQAEYDALPSSAKTDTSKMYIISDAEAGDLTNYYTKTETNTLLGGKADTATTYTKTEVDNAITAATSTKQDTLVSSENIKTINNESLLGSGNIDIQGGSGGGKAIEAGRGITVTTGATADTVSISLPISAGTGYNSVRIGAGQSAGGAGSVAEGYVTYANGDEGAHAEGYTTHANGKSSHAEGYNSEANGNYSHAEGNGTNASGHNSHAEGVLTKAIGRFSHTEGYRTIANWDAEHASGQYNISSSGSSTFGDSGNTLFSVGNGTADNARHNAFEIRQNGDIYITSGGTDIKLQDHLGGGGSSYSAGTGIDITNDVISVTGMVATSAVSSAVTSGDTNPVQNQALWNELRIENAPVETTLTFRQPVGEDNYWTTNYPSGCTTLVGNILRSSTQIELYNNSSDLGGFMINCYDGVLDSVSFWGIEGTYSISGSVVTISYPNVTNVTSFRIREEEYRPEYQTYKAMATVAPTVLKNQVNDNTTALGGLKLVKISQSDYENLQNKDNDTLYVILGS